MKNTGLEESLELGSLHDTIQQQHYLEIMVLDECLRLHYPMISEVDNTSVAVELPHSWERVDV